MRKATGLACAVILMGAAIASAQQVVPGDTTTTTTVQAAPGAVAPAGATTPQIRRMSQILGSNVVLQDNGRFGKVNDVVLNDNGAIEYVVVDNNGRYAMLPWSAGNYNWGQRSIRYDVTPQAIEPLYFNTNSWPNIADEAWVTKTRKVFPRYTFHRVSRPVPIGPAPGTAAPAPGAVVPAPAPGAVAPAPAPGERVKIKEKPNGKIKEKIKD